MRPKVMVIRLPMVERCFQPLLAEHHRVQAPCQLAELGCCVKELQANLLDRRRQGRVRGGAHGVGAEVQAGLLRAV